jgi:beta-fructofuranosidase
LILARRAVLHYAGYAVGTYAHGTFTASHWGRLTYGDSHYAPSFFRDSDGRPCLSFWMRGIADESARWASAHSVPYVLTLDGDILVATPHPDIDKYRQQESTRTVDGLAADVTWSPDAAGIAFESGGKAVVSLARENDEVIVAVGDQSWKTPYSGNIRIILDGPVLEVASAAGLFGSSIAPQGDTLTLQPTNSETACHALSR